MHISFWVWPVIIKKQLDICKRSTNLNKKTTEGMLSLMFGMIRTLLIFFTMSTYWISCFKCWIFCWHSLNIFLYTWGSIFSFYKSKFYSVANQAFVRFVESCLNLSRPVETGFIDFNAGSLSQFYAFADKFFTLLIHFPKNDVSVSLLGAIGQRVLLFGRKFGGWNLPGDVIFPPLIRLFTFITISNR